MSSRETTISASQIADLAGVTASAVSNWRRRFADFPRPVASTPGGRDLFSLEEVRQWLLSQGRLDSGADEKERLFQVADLFRGEAGATQLTEVLCAAIALASLWKRERGAGLEQPLSEMVELAREEIEEPEQVFYPLIALPDATASEGLKMILTLDQSSYPRLFEGVLEERGDRLIESRSSDQLVSLVKAARGSDPASILDPAAGEGGFLVALSGADGEREPSLYGQDVEVSAWRIAVQRCLVHGVGATIKLANSLVDDRFPNLQADLVVCDPPYGQRINWPTGAEQRWLVGRPSKLADYAWLQYVAGHLSEHGRGYVFLPEGSLWRGGKEADLRRELIRIGAVEAIASLPVGAARKTAVPLVLWVMRAPRSALDPASRVLFIKGSLSGFTPEQLIPTILSHWSETHEVEEHYAWIAASVPIIELLSADASLDPKRWVLDEPTEADLEERLLEFQEALEAFLDSPNQLEWPDAKSATQAKSRRRWESVGQLLAEGRAELVRGTRVAPEEHSETGVPILRPKDVANGLLVSTEERIELDSGSRRIPATRSGDIVINPVGECPRAAVDWIGDHVLAEPLVGLRLLGTGSDPEIAAAFVSSPHNRRFLKGTTARRVEVKDLELPVLTDEEARWLKTTIATLRLVQDRAGAIYDSAEALREGLLSLAIVPDSGVAGRG